MRVATHRCGARWHQRGEQTCHCASCHRTFSSLSAFDWHRVVEGDDRVCRDPAPATRPSGEPLFELRTDAAGCEV